MTALIDSKYGYKSIKDMPTSEELSSYYNDKYYDKDEGNLQYASEYSDEEIAHKKIVYQETVAIIGETHGKVFEIAFGEGFALNEFSQNGWQISGVDFTLNGLQQYFPELLANVRQGDAIAYMELLAEQGQKFDLIIANNVIEHVIDPEKLVRLMQKILTPNGWIRIVAPNDGNWLQSLIINKGKAKENYYVCPPEHLHYFTKEPLEKLVNANGFKVETTIADFPIDIFVLNPDSNYYADGKKGKNCHQVRVMFELELAQHSIEKSIAYKKGCADAGIGRDVIVYAKNNG
jgi:2-polyprenyl-3-methyl-5-hydroxy-6-metoxy-1,4-benzoquinol methylase